MGQMSIRSLTMSIIEFPTIADAEDVLRRLDGADLNGARVQLEIVPVSTTSTVLYGV